MNIKVWGGTHSQSLTMEIYTHSRGGFFWLSTPSPRDLLTFNRRVSFQYASGENLQVNFENCEGKCDFLFFLNDKNLVNWGSRKRKTWKPLPPCHLFLNTFWFLQADFVKNWERAKSILLFFESLLGKAEIWSQIHFYFNPCSVTYLVVWPWALCVLFFICEMSVRTQTDTQTNKGFKAPSEAMSSASLYPPPALGVTSATSPPSILTPMQMQLPTRQLYQDVSKGTQHHPKSSSWLSPKLGILAIFPIWEKVSTIYPSVQTKSQKSILIPPISSPHPPPIFHPFQALKC